MRRFLLFQHPVYIRFVKQKFLHFLTDSTVFRICRFLFCQQLGILRLQRFYCRQLRHAGFIKGFLRRLVEQYFTFMLGKVLF